MTEQTGIKVGDSWEHKEWGSIVRIDRIVRPDSDREVIWTTVVRCPSPWEMGSVVRWEPYHHFRREFRRLSPAPDGAPPLSGQLWAERKGYEALRQIEKLCWETQILCAELEGYLEAMRIHIRHSTEMQQIMAGSPAEGGNDESRDDIPEC